MQEAMALLGDYVEEATSSTVAAKTHLLTRLVRLTYRAKRLARPLPWHDHVRAPRQRRANAHTHLRVHLQSVVDEHPEERSLSLAQPPSTRRPTSV